YDGRLLPDGHRVARLRGPVIVRLLDLSRLHRPRLLPRLRGAHAALPPCRWGRVALKAIFTRTARSRSISKVAAVSRVRIRMSASSSSMHVSGASIFGALSHGAFVSPFRHASHSSETSLCRFIRYFDRSGAPECHPIVTLKS